MSDIRLLAGKEIIETDDIVSFIEQAFTEMRSEEASSARHQDRFHRFNVNIQLMEQI